VNPRGRANVRWAARAAACATALALFTRPAAAQESTSSNGLIRLRSDFPVSETLDRLERIAGERGLTVFRRIDHAAAAASVGVDLLPTQLLLFGSPRVGAPLMRCARETGIDLPMKALAWRDTEGRVWLTVNDPDYLNDRHGLGECEEIVSRARAAVLALVRAAAYGSGSP